ncbi:tRNA (adenosine(37)-N6)-threonylcarbamoyltransferase complex ATPase subunit type 1 TsaE [Geomicrobium sp. JCM 19038]|uniref:tRNA (adenosine(37)-N6)-threonylcarbamoyltransferase complex ATPase subunit type 1 TsaE n=1 Tax=Geomicrobium sp. JCM 19038 TaxID=1460635 RepID=UPI00045F3927|nr:tRNA (adenosine(37)-N6)-threonylcarbamoyltransferase complex ATPase subunit type 1 TsaE [Geomicrobium sp. JCM 19038]GAK10082.1 ATPase YjeE [Geomicrobium sp. JCM 19038]
MAEYVIHTKHVEETMYIGEQLAKVAMPGDVFALDGDLGAGKTHFSKGFAKGLHVEGNVNSPTFTIIKQYKGRLPLYHIDAYRLDDGEGEEIGLFDVIDGEGVSVIEWASIIEDELPDHTVRISLTRVSDEERQLQFKGVDERFEQVLKEFGQ